MEIHLVPGLILGSRRAGSALMWQLTYRRCCPSPLERRVAIVGGRRWDMLTPVVRISDPRWSRLMLRWPRLARARLYYRSCSRAVHDRWSGSRRRRRRSALASTVWIMIEGVRLGTCSSMLRNLVSRHFLVRRSTYWWRGLNRWVRGRLVLLIRSGRLWGKSVPV